MTIVASKWKTIKEQLNDRMYLRLKLPSKPDEGSDQYEDDPLIESDLEHYALDVSELDSE